MIMLAIISAKAIADPYMPWSKTEAPVEATSDQ